jgi:predicted metal-dependent hydrolase
MRLSHRPRFLPDRSLPPYTYVPGRSPHPVTDPVGHSFGRVPEPATAIDADNWHTNRAYLYGIDLFNHGYYWEAHEAWEGLWHLCGRKGTIADFLKGLIKLAAAGVKVREGQSRGVRSHAANAATLFRCTAERLSRTDARYLGLRVDEMIAFAESIEPDAKATDALQVQVVFDFVLRPAPTS